jgi:hypothetical protein
LPISAMSASSLVARLAQRHRGIGFERCDRGLADGWLCTRRAAAKVDRLWIRTDMLRTSSICTTSSRTKKRCCSSASETQRGRIARLVELGPVM